jgi:hypothetical protein
MGLMLACAPQALAGGSNKSGSDKKVEVKAHVKKDGTYVSAHTRSAPRTEARTTARKK